jgi:hypothetical protein
MKTFIRTATVPLLFALGCAGNHPAPNDQMAEVLAANRSANELGAQKNPKAQLHIKLAEDQVAQAKAAMAEDDNERADSLLIRAKADAELAIALTREENAQTQASNAVDQSNAQRSTHMEQGAQK